MRGPEAEEYGVPMLPRDIASLPEHVYPADEWKLVETRFPARHAARAETVFALSNGYLGIRGTFEEGRPAFSPGTFVNGFHETWPIVHPEEAFGLARTGQTIVNAPDATLLKLDVDDEPLFLPTARLQTYRRELDMQAGTVSRDLLWSTPAGKHVRIRSRRLVSFEHRHLAAMSYEVTMIDHGAALTISSELRNHEDEQLGEDSLPGRAPDPRLARPFPHRVLDAAVRESPEGKLLLGYRTTNSGMTLGVGVAHVIESEGPFRVTSTIDGDLAKVVVTLEATPNIPIRITKYVAYHTSRAVPPSELVDRCERTLDRAVHIGLDGLATIQREHLDRFWDRADVQVDNGSGTTRVQQAIRWNIFQLAQASWRAEGAGIPAKGLTGRAYEGHYFWDTEVYVLPFLAYTQPRIARNLLRFRHSMLGKAREIAATLSQRGALFPWRTINGEEASAYYQAGTAQYHINADIAYAIRKYVDIRGDVDFLVEVGAEILIETARLWEDLGFYGDDGRFHIHGVTGPDEYTTVVNDNTYTNLMARLNLNFAAAALRRIEQERPEGYRAVAADTRLAPDEIDGWERAAAAMYIPYDEERSINPQDESFLDREIWDLGGTPKDKFPLLLHYHPLVIYRFQVIKQSDVVLAMFLVGNEFSIEQKRRNFDYYDPLTTGDSSLAASVQSIVAAEIGNSAKALEYFDYSLMMDLGDIAGNVSDGVHIAAAGGVWMALVLGFGGVRDFDGCLCFEPHLPASWERLAFPLRFQDRQLRITLTPFEERYLVETGEALDVEIRGEPHRLEPGRPLVLRPQRTAARSAVTPEHFDAVLFDLDGVLTATARLHATCWKRTFDEYLLQRSAATGEPFREFEIATDYKRHVDGKLRYDGVQAFLLSRGIQVPWGDASDPPIRETVCGLGNRKNELVAELLATEGVDVFDGSVAWVRRLRRLGLRTAVVSASKNCARVLEAAGIAGLFDTRVDGVVAGELELRGKPAPDTFLEAAQQLGVDPKRAVVVEDAVSGVEAGRAGGFGLVIGVDRTGDPTALHDAGADFVLADLGELVDHEW